MISRTHPVPLNTVIRCNEPEADTFPFCSYAKSEGPRNAVFSFETTFPGASAISWRFHQNSAINSHQTDKKVDREKRDILQIFADSPRDVLLQTINSDKMKDHVDKDEIVIEENKSSLYFSFLYTSGNLSAAGFSLTLSADFSNFEFRATLGPTYRKEDKIRENGSEVEIGCIALFASLTPLELMFTSKMSALLTYLYLMS